MLALSMPMAKTVGLPDASANVWSWWIGLKSPEAPAYFTKSVRVNFSTLTSGSAWPSFTSSQYGVVVGIVASPLASVLHDLAGLDPHRAGPRHQLAPLVPV